MSNDDSASWLRRRIGLHKFRKFTSWLSEKGWDGTSFVAYSIYILIELKFDKICINYRHHPQ